MEETRLYTLFYVDKTDAHIFNFSNAPPIIAPEGRLTSIYKRKLLGKYLSHNVSFTQANKEYLIKGALIQWMRIPKSMAISAESLSTLEEIVSLLGLPLFTKENILC